MSKRKGISTRSRFEVFKRDAFTCQYCGNTPPSVILHVDHIVPVAHGGSDDTLNLITACSQCNLGKSDRALDTLTVPLKETIETERERREQVDAYNEFLYELRDKERHDVEQLGLYWHNLFMNEKDEFVFGHVREQSVRTFLKSLPVVVIMNAMDKAHAKVPVRSNDNQTFRYFCGICWNIIKGEERG